MVVESARIVKDPSLQRWWSLSGVRVQRWTQWRMTVVLLLLGVVAMVWMVRWIDHGARAVVEVLVGVEVGVARIHPVGR